MISEDKRTVGFRVLYSAAFGVWLLLTVLAFTYVLRDSIGQVESEFRQHSELAIAELRDKLKANEAVLAGFASFLGAVEASDRQSVRHYASSMLASYPHIYMLEVVRRIERRDRPQFERQMQATWSPEFRIRNFDYAGSRDWAPLADKPSYRPIVFIWPELAEAQAVIGLDIDAVPHLRKALTEAETQRAPISSPPFSLVEGDKAYVMFRPAQRGGAQAGARPEHSFGGPLTALLVIRASALLPAAAQVNTAQKLQITRNGEALEPALYDVRADTASDLERRLFPMLQIQTSDYSTSQPMQLTVERQVRLADLSSKNLVLMTALALLTLTLLAAYLRRHHRDLEHTRALEERSAHLALHDPLTGLPNRNLLEDRGRQSLAAWRRRGQRFALLFLDLDKFKAINDEHGHEVGDRLLTAVSYRLHDAVRESDTVARYGGDEFVILISGFADEADITAVCNKILEAVARPFELGRVTLRITTSLGISLCPEDGDSFETLLNNADGAMYEAKRDGRNGIGRSLMRASSAGNKPTVPARQAEDVALESLSRIRLVR